MNRTKNVLTIVVFIAVIFGILIWSVLLPDAPMSRAERRLLSQRPEFSAKTFFDGKYSPDLERYLLDQFPARDSFRALKSRIAINMLRKTDNNGYFTVGDSISKLDYALSEAGVGLTVKKLNSLISRYMSDSQVYYSVIPDKNFFLAAANGFPSMDYDRLLELLNQGLDKRFEYIDIFHTLDEESYYRTDLHWRQEKIFPAAEALARAMDVGILPPEAYTTHDLKGFEGAFLGQSALGAETDDLVYMTAPLLDHAKAYSVELGAEIPVYSPEKIHGADGYDVFLSGAQAIVTIDFPDLNSDRRLVLFRDSFGSAIAPLFAGEYSQITLVDLRYVSSEILGEYVDFENADVLFLYGSSLVNSGGLLR